MKYPTTSKGEFPDCGCHYTTDDDGIHFCSMHKAAPGLLAELKNVARLISRDSGSPRFTSKQYDRLMALLAKAEGSAQ